MIRVISYLLRGFKSRRTSPGIPRTSVPVEQEKRRGELEFWRLELTRYVQWLRGEIPNLYEIGSPNAEEIVPAESVIQSAVLTWARKDGDKYLRHLHVSPDCFSGRSVLEIGCGPLPYALCFVDCQLIGLDPLLGLYLEAGYPLACYSRHIRYMCGVGEKIPLATNSVDAMVSVNAIDHTDDLWQVAKEIDRVLVPDGVILLEAHYHDSTSLEPWALNDSVMQEAFCSRSLVKAMERSFDSLYPMYPERKHEVLTVWTNRPEMVGG